MVVHSTYYVPSSLVHFVSPMCVGKLLPQMTKKIRENTQEKKRMSFTYINPGSIPKGGTHEETPRGGN